MYRNCCGISIDAREINGKFVGQLTDNEVGKGG
jgi:hypothetical protein